MPEFTLYGNRGSAYSNCISLALAEAGFTDFEFVTLDFQKAEHKHPDHLSRHPWGRVPAITTSDGLNLCETRAICKYLASKYSFPLLPPVSDLAATALFDQAQSAEASYFAPHASKISFEKFAKPILGIPTDTAAVDAARKSIEAHFDAYDRILDRQEYMAGNAFSLVDIYYIPLVERLFSCEEEVLISSRKNVNVWWERCMNRPAVKNFIENVPKLDDIRRKMTVGTI